MEKCEVQTLNTMKRQSASSAAKTANSGEINVLEATVDTHRVRNTQRWGELIMRAQKRTGDLAQANSCSNGGER